MVREEGYILDIFDLQGTRDYKISLFREFYKNGNTDCLI